MRFSKDKAWYLLFIFFSLFDRQELVWNFLQSDDINAEFERVYDLLEHTDAEKLKEILLEVFRDNKAELQTINKLLLENNPEGGVFDGRIRN